MDIATATYSELKLQRDQIEIRLRELERQTLEDIERKARDFGFALGTTQQKPQRRKRRTKAEIEAARAQAE